jgi:type 1 glutamine amidotransferase
MKKPNAISRRELLQNVGTAAAVGALAGVETRATSQVPAVGSGDSGSDPRLIALMGEGGNGKLPRTLALIGDRYHNTAYVRTGLDRVFGELGLTIDYTANYDNLSQNLLAHYQLFVCLRDDMIWPGGYSGPNHDPHQDFLENPEDFPPEKPVSWITEEQAKAVKDFVSAGNGFYSLHNNAFVSRSSKNFRDVQGGVALGHPPLRPFKVRIVNKDHPVTQGVQDFMVTDEQEYTIYDKDPKNILLRGENIDGFVFDRPTFQDEASKGANAQQNLGTVSISGWAHEYGKGRVVFTALGHTIDAMWQPEHYKLQKNAVRWLLRIA